MSHSLDTILCQSWQSQKTQRCQIGKVQQAKDVKTDMHLVLFTNKRTVFQQQPVTAYVISLQAAEIMTRQNSNALLKYTLTYNL